MSKPISKHEIVSLFEEKTTKLSRRYHIADMHRDASASRKNARLRAELKTILDTARANNFLV